MVYLSLILAEYHYYSGYIKNDIDIQYKHLSYNVDLLRGIGTKMNIIKTVLLH